MLARNHGSFRTFTHNSTCPKEDSLTMTISNNGKTVVLSIELEEGHFQIEEFTKLNNKWTKVNIRSTMSPSIFSDIPVTSITQDGSSIIVYDRDFLIVKTGDKESVLSKPLGIVSPIEANISLDNNTAYVIYKDELGNKNNVLVVYARNGRSWHTFQTFTLEPGVNVAKMSGNGNVLLIPSLDRETGFISISVHTRVNKLFYKMNTSIDLGYISIDKIKSRVAISGTGTKIATLVDNTLTIYTVKDNVVTAYKKLFIANAVSVRINYMATVLSIEFIDCIEFFELSYEDCVSVGRVRFSANSRYRTVSSDLDVLLVSKQVLDTELTMFKCRVRVVDLYGLLHKSVINKVCKKLKSKVVNLTKLI